MNWQKVLCHVISFLVAFLGLVALTSSIGPLGWGEMVRRFEMTVYTPALIVVIVGAYFIAMIICDEGKRTH